MRKRCFLVFTVLCFGLWALDASGQTELTGLINYALEHSRTVRKANLQVQEADYMHKEALGYGLPQVEGSATLSKMMFEGIDIPASLYTMVPSQYAPILDKLGSIDKFYSASAGIQVTQLIYSQAYWVGLKTTKKVQELNLILKNKSEEDVIAEVANTYYQIGSLMLQHKTVIKSVQNLKEMFRISEASYKNDFIKETDLSRLKVTITNLEVTQQTIQNGINIQLNYLKALVGMPIDSMVKVDTTSLIWSDNKSFNSAFQIENVPSYQALMKQADLYDQQTRLAKAKYYPTLAAFGKINYSSYNTSLSFNTWSNMNTIGLSLTIPIFTSGVTSSKIKQSIIKQKQLDEDVLQTKDFLRVEYDNALSEYQTAQNLLLAQKENKELALKVYGQTMLQYKEGMAMLADLLNVNSDFLQADNSYNQQVLKCKISEIRMLKASGNLKIIVNQK